MTPLLPCLTLLALFGFQRIQVLDEQGPPVPQAQVFAQSAAATSRPTPTDRWGWGQARSWWGRGGSAS